MFTSPPYEAARTYGIDFTLKGDDWVQWAADRFEACVEGCNGLVAWVVEWVRKVNAFDDLLDERDKLWLALEEAYRTIRPCIDGLPCGALEHKIEAIGELIADALYPGGRR